MFIYLGQDMGNGKNTTATSYMLALCVIAWFMKLGCAHCVVLMNCLA